ncbi:MAG: SUMF1/EgtB/PvdO family nonheme iron enzyme [Myxococcota bacterium]
MARRCVLPSSFLLLLASCSGPTSSEHEIVDTPEAAPTRVEAPTPPEPKDGAKSELDSSDECGRTTGRNEEGQCEALRTREVEHVQQVQIPAGRFVMGDVPRTYTTAVGRHDPRERWPGQPPRYADSESFWIDLHEVTRGEYEKCVESGSCTPAQCFDGVDPVEKFSDEAAALIPQTCVTHAQATTFCETVGARLPSETEWELAARGVDVRIYPWGNDMRDEYNAMLVPVNVIRGDSSYFGIRGMGTNALEWVSDTYEVDNGLEPYLGKPFRDDNGPLMKAEAARGPRFVMKGGKAGARRDKAGADRRLGFRCAADVSPDDGALKIPAEVPTINVLRPGTSELLVFGGIAEAVSRKEAEQFCDALRIPQGPLTLEGFRLPTLAEIQAMADAFRGPGPFWSADGSAVQKGKGNDAPWEIEESTPKDALGARCVVPLNG